MPQHLESAAFFTEARSRYLLNALLSGIHESINDTLIEESRRRQHLATRRQENMTPEAKRRHSRGAVTSTGSRQRRLIWKEGREWCSTPTTPGAAVEKLHRPTRTTSYQSEWILQVHRTVWFYLLLWLQNDIDGKGVDSFNERELLQLHWQLLLRVPSLLTQQLLERRSQRLTKRRALLCVRCFVLLVDGVDRRLETLHADITGHRGHCDTSFVFHVHGRRRDAHSGSPWLFWSSDVRRRRNSSRTNGNALLQALAAALEEPDKHAHTHTLITFTHTHTHTHAHTHAVETDARRVRRWSTGSCTCTRGPRLAPSQNRAKQNTEIMMKLGPCK